MAPMTTWWRNWGGWLAGGVVLSVLGGWAIAQAERTRLRDAFETDARIAHRLLSQRAVELDAVLATLALLQPAAEPTPSERRLPSVYPQILEVLRRGPETSWPTAALQAADESSRQLRRPVLASQDLAQARYQLALNASPASFAVLVDIQRFVPWSEWPTDPATSPVRTTLEHKGQAFVIQPGLSAGGSGASGSDNRGVWQFDFRKHLATESQPFDVVSARAVGWRELPWWAMAGWVVACSLAMGAGAAWQRQRDQRRRAEDLLRLGQVARLNTLGELAGGMAHELNQPLTALLANTQAAQRLLAEQPVDLDVARQALQQASQQARRAADVVGRLRRLVERPDTTTPPVPVFLQDAVRSALHLLAPECTRRQVTPQVSADAPVWVAADPVALDQIVHNLLLNALQALDSVPAPQRELRLGLATDGQWGLLTVADRGPGIAPEALPRLFEPFFSGRKGGLGLGLSLCETLAGTMQGSLTAENQPAGGALFTLRLPLARPAV